MSKRIIGVFDTREGGQQAAQSLLRQHIAPDRLLLLAGAPVANGEDHDEVGAGQAAGTVAGAGLAGLATFVVPGIGIFLGAATAIAALGLAAAASENTEPGRPVDLEQMLVKLGLLPEQARGYAGDVRQGRTLLGVEAEAGQTDLIADVMHQHGGYKLEFRPEA